MIIYETQQKKSFGIILGFPTKHKVEVRILQRKTVGDDTTFVHKSEIFSAKQVVLLHREVKK